MDFRAFDGFNGFAFRHGVGSIFNAASHVIKGGPMAYEYSYAWEKFGRAVCSLATGEDEIRKRLLLVFQGDLLMITPEHLPTRLRDDYQWIKEEITKFDEKHPGYNKNFETDDGRFDHLIPTKLEATLFRIRRATGAKIARKLFHIWSVLDEEFRTAR